MVDIPIDPPCCVVLKDSRIRNAGITSGKCKMKLGGLNHSNFYAWRKHILLTGIISILLIVLFLIITDLRFPIMSEHDARNASVRIQPEIHVERTTRLNFPLNKGSLSKSWWERVIDGDLSFNDQAELTSQITQVAEGHTFPTINGRDADMRSKRDVSRRRRDCDLTAKTCEKLLKTIEDYLTVLSNQFSSLPSDILECLECKKLINVADEDHTPLSKDQYFPPHNYAEQNHSSPAANKLPDDGKAENSSKRTEINRTVVQPVVVNNSLQNVTNQSLSGTSIAKTTTVSIGHTDSNGSQRVSDTDVNNSVIKDKQSDGNPAANDSRVIKIQNAESIPGSKINQQHRVTTESNDVTSAKSWFMKSSSTGTQYGAITRDNGQFGKTTIAVDSIGTTEARTRTIDPTKRITENVTSMPVGYNVTRIDGSTVHPSVQPSPEGHPENRSANELRSMKNHHDYERFASPNHYQVKDNDKPIPVTAESTKSFQQLQLTPTMWTMPHPVCFFGQYPFGQTSNMPLSPASGLSSAQSGFPFRNPNQDSSSPNYVHVQANTVQFLPRFNYASSLSQPIGQGIGPTGPAMSNAPVFALNQQPTAMSQQPNMPYFCGYISLPTIRFPPIPGTSQDDRSADEAKDLRKKWGKSSQTYDVMTRNKQDFSICPLNYRQCDNLHCIPRGKWCNGHIDCTDASDEIRCSCRDRISRERLCDGYFDCPHGEDELGCFGCSIESFSCGDEDRRYNSDDCVSLSQRCDGIKQCSNGKDELDCNILLETPESSIDSFMIGYTQGYLHKNIRGQWYPVCSKTTSWALDACAAEMGWPLTTMPEIQMVHVTENPFQNLYVVASDNGDIELTVCPDTAIFVKCPSLPCGTKALPRQNFSPINTAKNNYTFMRHAKEQSVSEFNKETLELLSANQSILEEKVQDQNDSIVGSQSRVVGGRASQPKAWPFLVVIYKDGNFHCGGIILDEIHILTAGHCMSGYKNHYYEIQAGLLRRLSFAPMAQSRTVKYTVIHPAYAKEEMQNDLAVIRLAKPLLFNRWVRQVCLPAFDTAGPEWKKGPSPQSVCVAIGWGALREFGPDPDHLREVELPILPSCKYPADQNDATICAGYPEGGHDACQGDSGGPLMCRNPNLESQWYAAGLVSHGDGCGRPNEPGVYMKMSYYVDWILQTFETLNNRVMFSHGDKPLDSCPGFSCYSNLKECLPLESRCNGIVNCLDGEDEIGCEILKMNKKYRDSDSSDTSIKPQDEIVSAITEENEANKEAIPIPTSSYFFYQTDTQTSSSENSNNMDISITTPEATMSSVSLTFTCKHLIQTITINKRCDKHLDCQDGTDEEDCTCRDYLLNFQPAAICDGHLDCNDKTDEKNCGICKDDEFHCSRSGGCVPMTKRCNTKFDCPLREDEADCLALTNGEYISMDSDNRPVLNTEGVVSRYYNRTWLLECPQSDILRNNTITSIIGGNVCKYLGFTSLQSLGETVVNKTMLETRFSWRDNVTGYEPERSAASEGGEPCTTLRFRCRPVLSSSAESHLILDPRTGNHTYLWPWQAAIFVDGRYHCSALLLEPDWLLSSSSCTEAIRLSVNYTTALLGRSRSFLYVDGPHQQISVVDEIRDVKKTDVSLLHLKTAVNFTRYVQPLFLEKKIYPPAENDLCVAVGTNNEHLTQSIFLQPVLENCDKCYRCFVEALGNKCPEPADGISSNWSGTVFCRSEAGWYPAAVFHENDGPCSFRSTQNLTSIDYVQAYLMQALEGVPQPTSEAACDGVRCNIGQCIPWNQTCDGVADCRDGADETDEMCLMQQARRESGMNRNCAKSELRCGNGECVSKSAFCDGKVDCSDGTDEPVICSCAEYLKLTTPERVCDGVRHCLDKSDESLETCRCMKTSFICSTDKKNITCVSQDFVCDGDDDCPNGEDERECRKVQKLADRPAAGEVVERSYGVWHTLCYPSVILSREEAINVCRKSGYADGIIDYEYQIFDQPVVPARDDFYMIRLNSGTWITMRDDKPLITLVRPEKPCYRLFVKCN